MGRRVTSISSIIILGGRVTSQDFHKPHVSALKCLTSHLLNCQEVSPDNMKIKFKGFWARGKNMKVPTMNYVFNLAIKIIVIILTVFIIAVLVVGLFHTIWEIKEFLFTKSIGQSFKIIVVNILTFLVIIELFRSFVVYFESHRFRLNTMIDPAIIFLSVN